MKQKHKNNILLAEFLDMLTTDSEGNIKEDVNSFKFHNDWNWIMLVLQKCDAVAYELGVHEDWIEKFQTSLSQYEIRDMYDVCVEFVKFYNDNKIKKDMKEAKRLFITLEVIEGDRKHNHRCLHVTDEQDIYKAADIFARDYWGENAEKIDEYWLSFGGEIAIRYTKVKELSENEYDFLHDLLYSPN